MCRVRTLLRGRRDACCLLAWHRESRRILAMRRVCRYSCVIGLCWFGRSSQLGAQYFKSFLSIDACYGYVEFVTFLDFSDQRLQ